MVIARLLPPFLLSWYHSSMQLNPDDISQALQWVFMAVISAGITFSTKFLQGLSRSVAELNRQIAVVLERIGRHEKDIERLDGRIDQIEKHRK